MIEEALALLRSEGVEAEAVATTAPGSAGAQARASILQGCDAVLACGGDGTAHEIVQSLVGTQTALGVVPLGTANALAADLGLSSSPVQALRMLLNANRERVPVGRIFYHDPAGVEHSRYFVVAAGIGADAQLMSRLDARLKRRFGYILYAVEGLRVLATHSFPAFQVTFVEHQGNEPRRASVSQLLAIRIRDFGGMLHRLVPGATLRNGSLRLVAFKTRSRFDFVRFLAAVLFRRQTFSGRIELLDAVSVECFTSAGSRSRVFVEADGEMLGELPVRMEIVPDALTLLVPPQSQP